MGCDIHMHCEEYVPHVEKWFCADHWKLNKYFNSNDPNEKKYTLVSLYANRNYTLFTALAGVRGYSDEPRIFDPKGLPDDCTEAVKEHSDEWGSDGHSHSYITLRELKEYLEERKKIEFLNLCQYKQSECLNMLYELMAKRFSPYRNIENLPEDKLDHFRIIFWFDS